MASADRLTRLVNIRDNLEKELEDATAAFVLNGPKPSYSVSGKSVNWDTYRQSMLDAIERAQRAVVQAGGDGGLYEEHVRGYS